MNLKPMILGIATAAIVTTAIVDFTSEPDNKIKITFAPATAVEAVPAPMVDPVTGIGPVKAVVRPAEDDAYLRGVKAAANCPAVNYTYLSSPKPVAKAKHHAIKAKHAVAVTH